ncbi:cyclohexanone monooxygenase [Sphingomonas sp. Leaf357]|uniref:flavin-containing monooxygenase n=1 Tax=Sphingomonas sp. Leaf357 TaxID=1736350 RepID=UPI0006FF927F|nr:NAD(P)/FAD-dependent oxidoreductase [Sphingomonas sp. Leaf357]KQS03660.1 cyclohexanone monooxygenase [Sphingomonas sp. Leaf357]
MDPREIDVVVVGAGFAGLYMIHKLRTLGFGVQGFEAGADVGGTWYFNRYPGARCDVESFDYSYSFDSEIEQEWNWTERFATQPEILRYIRHVADRLDLRRDIRFSTRVAAATWNEDQRRWQVTTDAGEMVAARYLILATGSLSAAKAPEIAGLDSFGGETLHTSSWPEEGVDFTGQRVGIIGTGSSAIQAIPLIAQQADHLTVFQRTPAFSLPARNAPLDDAAIAARKHEYRRHRARCRATQAGVLFRGTDVPALSMGEEERRAAYETAWANGGQDFVRTFKDLILNRAANDTASCFVREKIAEVVADPATAAALTPRDFPIGSKRVAVDTDYYETFNRPNVSLVNLRDTPIERIEASGVRTRAGVVPLDALILATGFDAITGSFLRIAITNGDGATLAEKWAAGPQTYLGLGMAGFPNLFIVAGPGSPSVLVNMVLAGEQHVEWIADCLVSLRTRGLTRIEAQADAERKWVDRVNALANKTLFMAGDSWYLGANVPGKPRVFMPFVGGFASYAAICDDVAGKGYEGFTLS